MATFKDPVCGMDVEPQNAAASEEYDRKTYYFCSAACHEKFKTDPRQYAS